MTTPAPSISRRVSRKASLFTESVIREMTRVAMKHGAVNLSQGFPDFAAPEDIKRVAMQAIADDVINMPLPGARKTFAMPSPARRNGIWVLRLIPSRKLRSRADRLKA